MPDVTLLRSEGELQTRFKPRLWTLFHDVPRLYESILSSFRDSVGPSDIRPETGDGSLGGYSVAFWLTAIRGTVRFRIDTGVVTCADLLTVDRSRLLASVDSAIATIRGAQTDIAFLGHTVSHSCHLRLAEPATVPEYLARFTHNAPQAEETGGLLASSVAFHYGQRGAVLNSSVTLERSLLFEGAIFARTTLILSGDIISAEGILDLSGKTVLGMLRSADLVLPELE